MDYFDLDAYDNPFAGIQAFIHEACFGKTPTVPRLHITASSDSARGDSQWILRGSTLINLEEEGE